MRPSSSPDFTFPGRPRQPGAIVFDAPDIVSDTGRLTLGDLDSRLGYRADRAGRLPDPRAQQVVPPTKEQLLTQQVYQILADYPDCNDANTLRQDPLFRALAGRDPGGDAALASGSTLARYGRRPRWRRRGPALPGGGAAPRRAGRRQRGARRQQPGLSGAVGVLRGRGTAVRLRLCHERRAGAADRARLAGAVAVLPLRRPARATGAALGGARGLPGGRLVPVAAGALQAGGDAAGVAAAVGGQQPVGAPARAVAGLLGRARRGAGAAARRVEEGAGPGAVVGEQFAGERLPAAAAPGGLGVGGRVPGGGGAGGRGVPGEGGHVAAAALEGGGLGGDAGGSPLLPGVGVVAPAGPVAAGAGGGGGLGGGAGVPDGGAGR